MPKIKSKIIYVNLYIYACHCQLYVCNLQTHHFQIDGLMQAIFLTFKLVGLGNLKLVMIELYFF